MKSLLFICFVGVLSVTNVNCSIFEINCCFVQQHPDIVIDGDNECLYESTLDSEDKAWFILENSYGQYHFPHPSSNTTIKYYVSEHSSHDSSLNWSYNMPNNSLGEEVKHNFLNSILKWNNIYFYQNSFGTQIVKKKMVNIIEGTSTDYNIFIHPEKKQYMYFETSAAETVQVGNHSFYSLENGVVHKHYENWDIALNLESTGINTNNNNYYLNRYGAHEFGHVLGLKDIDALENVLHHNELLMGYAYPAQSEITYKDLVGAAITRGYHTDLDHKWMYDSTNSSSGNYKLICSICNGVKYVESLSGYTYVNFKACNNNHLLSSGNMFATASYDNYDYYKCRYCKYVAPFTDIVEQDYTKTYTNESFHTVTNQVNGLSYIFVESHNLDSTNTCDGCGHHFHYYTDHYVPKNAITHKAYCSCGSFTLATHVVELASTYTMNGHIYGNCVDCGTLVDLTTTNVIVQGLEGLMVTDNGSYISPCGIYVIVPEDLESYLNGTLHFHPYDEVTI